MIAFQKVVYGIDGDDFVETEMHCIKLLGDKLSTNLTVRSMRLMHVLARLK